MGEQKSADWVAVARTSVDKAGRFYLPRETCRQLFGDGETREVQVYVGPDKTICLQVVEKPKRKASGS